MARATFRWTHVCFFLDFSFKKDAVPGLRIETRIRTEVRIRASKERSPDCFCFLLLLFAFCFCFCFTPFFHDFKGIKTKEKSKTKKNQSPDPSILGWVQTRDPDPDHFGPDFDSGSGYGSAFTDP